MQGYNFEFESVIEIIENWENSQNLRFSINSIDIAIAIRWIILVLYIEIQVIYRHQ